MLVCETRLDSYAPQAWLDTLTINTDDQTIVAVWRTAIPLFSEQPSFEVKRVIVTLEPEREPRPLGVVYRDLQRGDFFRAWEEQDVRGTAIDWQEEGEDLELEMERYDAFDLPPEPTISIEHYASICAELAAAQQSRPDVLARHQHTEDSWLLEDQGWIERIGDAVTSGDPSLSETYTKLYWARVAQLEEGAKAS